MRALLAFVVAPLWVPMAVAVYASQVVFPYEGQGHWVVIAALIGALFAYGGTLVLGVPAYLFLKRRHWTSLWIAVVAGFVIGAVAWQVFIFTFVAWGFGLGAGTRALLAQSLGPGLLEAAKPGLLGALVGLTAWLIIRPRRRVERPEVPPALL